MMRFRWIVLAVFVSACSNPHNTPIPKDLAGMESIRPSLDKLTPEEKELVGAYVVRHTVGSALGTAFGAKGDPIPEGMTIGKAIEEQRTFVLKQRAEEASRQAAIQRAREERKALALQLAQLVGVRLTDVSLHTASYRDMDVKSRINFTIEFENKGAKEIAGIKGVATFRDKFGDVVSSLPIKMQQTVPVAGTVKVVLSKDFNQFNDDDRRLANVDAANVTFELAPDVVLFGDGTKFEAPSVVKE